MLIPTMKPTDMPKAEKPAEKVEETPVSAPVEQEEKIDFSKVEIEPLLPILLTLRPLVSPISGRSRYWPAKP